MNHALLYSLAIKVKQKMRKRVLPALSGNNSAWPVRVSPSTTTTHLSNQKGLKPTVTGTTDNFHLILPAGKNKFY